MSDQPEDKAAAPTATPPHKKSPRHELRTPLNQIIGYAEMLEEEALDAKQEGFIPDLRKIAGAAHTLVGLVDKYGALLEERAPAAHASAPLVTPAASVAAPTPRAVEPQPESTPIKKRKRASESAPSSSVEGGPAQERLLVVDDNELNRDMLSRRLAKQGYPVDVAEDGYVALDKIDQGDYALVLLDIMMPGLSGLDVLKTVRATHTMAELPIIMATAKDQSEDTVEALGLGANDYVTKPLDFPVVMARVSTQLALKRASEEIRRLAESLERRNQFIRKTFGRYLSDDIVAELLETPHGLALGGESRIVTVLMSDLRGFTATADRLSPEQVVRILNRYLGVMADVITRFKGTIDEFIGDAVLALFGAPTPREDDPLRAVACAVEMQNAMAKVNAENERDGLPALEMGIAVNTGALVVGNIGSETRAKYGVVGATVNHTARIESCTLGGQIFISATTLAAIEGHVVMGPRMQVDAKGCKEPLAFHALYEVGAPYDLKAPKRADSLRALEQPLVLQYSIVEGKKTSEDVQRAQITHLGKKSAVIAGEVAPDLLSNVRIRFLSAAGEIRPGDLYAKVVEPGRDAGSFVVGFTSIPPEHKDLLDQALAQSQA